jgi:outer membrane protein assembly factor BamE (lipoprotein component of BamABCDE complex)
MTSLKILPKFLSRVATAGALCLALGACTATVDTRGNIAEADRLRQIRPGVSTRDDVMALLGTPSSTGTFDPGTWYYIGQRTEKTAFFRPDVVERKVVVVRFDPQGTVRELNQLDAGDGMEVALVDRKTPTAGKELGMVEQILGNVGRFSGNQRTRTAGQVPRIP